MRSAESLVPGGVFAAAKHALVYSILNTVNTMNANTNDHGNKGIGRGRWVSVRDRGWASDEIINSEKISQCLSEISFPLASPVRLQYTM